MSKNKGNLKYYELKGKIKHQKNNKEKRSKQDGSDTEEDEEIKTISNNGGTVL